MGRLIPVSCGEPADLGAGLTVRGAALGASAAHSMRIARGLACDVYLYIFKPCWVLRVQA